MALRIQHDVSLSRRHTKTSKPRHPPLRFPFGIIRPIKNWKRHYVINRLTTQTHCRMKTYDDVTGSS